MFIRRVEIFGDGFLDGLFNGCHHFVLREVGHANVKNRTGKCVNIKRHGLNLKNILFVMLSSLFCANYDSKNVRGEEGPFAYHVQANTVIVKKSTKGI